MGTDGTSGPEEPGTCVLVGGEVLVDPRSRATTTALAMAGGRVVALGQDAASLAGPGVEVVDLEGGLAVPAFGDGHCHPVFAGLEHVGPAVGAASSVEQVVGAVREFASARPDREWITGASYDPALAPDGAFDARWLDAACPDRPVLLRANDYHTVWCNTEALRRAGVTRDTPDGPRGQIDRRPDGEPLGTLREWDACDLVLDAAPAPDRADLRAALRRACRAQNAVGVTWMQDAWVDPGMHEPYLDLLADGELTVRSTLALRADPARWPGQLAEMVEVRDLVGASGDQRWLRADTVKFFADGVIESGTGAMLEPYADTGERGMEVWSRQDLADAVRAVDALGFQVHIHAIGDAAVRSALDAIELAVRVNPGWDRRPTLAHVQVIDPADLPRFAALGVIANVEAYWAQWDPLQSRLTAPRLGPGRADLQYPFATLAERGVVLAHGSDWPVSTNDPLAAMSVAVLRREGADQPPSGWLPHERLTASRALEAATWGAAVQGRTEGFRGRLDVGRTADVAVLNRDVLHCPPEEIATTRCVATWVAGRRVGA